MICLFRLRHLARFGVRAWIAQRLVVNAPVVLVVVAVVVAAVAAAGGSDLVTSQGLWWYASSALPESAPARTLVLEPSSCAEVFFQSFSSQTRTRTSQQPSPNTQLASLLPTLNDLLRLTLHSVLSW